MGLLCLQNPVCLSLLLVPGSRLAFEVITELKLLSDET